MESSLQIEVSPTTAPVAPERLAEILAVPGFGQHFTDHMFVAEWTPEQGWHDARVEPYAPISLDPATAVLHYAQEIFEGLKAYRHADGSVWTFRPEENGARMVRSARRLALPELPVADFVASVDAIVRADERWVPEPTGEKSLYVRPFMFASEKFLGVRSETLKAHGAVSEATALEMAEGARRETGADYAISVTGIAGPSGGTPEKPVGTVFVGLSTPEKTIARKYYNPYDRETFKQVTAYQALDLLRRKLSAIE